VFHWSLVLTFTLAWVTGDEIKSVHELAGYVIVGLLAIRIIWGFVGTTHARFTDFVYWPSAVIGYLRDTLRLKAKRYLGHNPAGGAMVLMLMATLVIICATGVTMAETNWGNGLVKDIHEMAATVALVLVGFHLAGVLMASIEHRENLVRSMFTGRKRPL
ncbi:cytochrome b/b6 domain-containing protein, partial [Rhizobiaceae sp. 2RAB30]